MKILISPSKTKKQEKEIVEFSNKYISDKTKYLINILSKLSKEEQIKIYKSEKIAKKYMDIYKRVSENDRNIDFSKAIFTYSGLVYKKFNIEDNINDYKNLDKIYILSALFGLLSPFDMIFDYRLDLEDKIGIDLEKYWKEYINEKLKDEDLIINLASNEYSKLLDHHNIITIEFYILNKYGNYVKQSTDSKIKRGLFLKELMKLEKIDEESIKNIVVGNARYVEKLNSKPNIFKFYEE